LEEKKKYDSPEEKAKRSKMKEENTGFIVDRTPPELLSKPGMFIKKGQPVNVAFGVKKFGDTKSDFNGVMMGPTFYSEFSDPVINNKALFYFPSNPLKASGKVQNLAKSIPGSNAKFVFWDLVKGKWSMFYDDVTCKLGPTYISAMIPAKGDSPFNQNTVMSGGVELGTNKDTWKLMNKDGGKHKVTLFDLNDGKNMLKEAVGVSTGDSETAKAEKEAKEAAEKGSGAGGSQRKSDPKKKSKAVSLNDIDNGKKKESLSILKIIHKIVAPPATAAIYKTKSSIEIKVLKEVEEDGEGVYETILTQTFSIEDAPLTSYQFQYSTSLKQHYFKKSEDFDKDDYDMIIRYKDNKGTNVKVDARTSIFTRTDSYGLLLGETFEKMQPKLPIYNHKWISFNFSTASNGYDMVTERTEEYEEWEMEEGELMAGQKAQMSQEAFQDELEQYEEDITIMSEHIYEIII